MFQINYKDENQSYQYIELVVHGDLKLYRKAIKNSEDLFEESLDYEEVINPTWEVQGNDGKWRDEFILNEIIEELYHSKQEGYLNTLKKNKP